MLSCPQCKTTLWMPHRFCPHCGQSRSVVRWAPVLVCLILMFVAIAFWVPRLGSSQQSHESNRAWVHPVQRKTENLAPGGPAATMARIDDLLRTAGVSSNLSRALGELEQLLAAYPQHAYAWRLKGNLHRQLQQRQRAKLALLTYLELQPGDARTRLSLAQLLYEQQDDLKTIVHCRLILAEFPQYLAAHQLLIQALSRLDDQEGLQQQKQLAARVVDRKPPTLFLERLPGVSP